MTVLVDSKVFCFKSLFVNVGTLAVPNAGMFHPCHQYSNITIKQCIRKFTYRFFWLLLH